MLKAPFPYFGGKRTVADVVWQALGNPGHYIEPFFGSGAVLLLRPDYSQDMTETVCDKDGYVCNVWRAIRENPEEVARWCDWPVNHADLCARRKKLLMRGPDMLEKLIADDEWYDAKMAGYWAWAASCWIGSGLTRPNAIPHISDAGKGAHSQIPHVSDAGKGVHAQIPHVSDAGKGGGACGSVHEWLVSLSQRLRRVRVVCGDWSRVCGGNWQDRMGVCGIFFDPPYGVSDRYRGVYDNDSVDVAHVAAQWALDRGGNEKYRIVFAGYDEHEKLLEAGWTSMQWKTCGGYGNTAWKAGGQGKENRHRETLYFSPHCIRKDSGSGQTKLFEGVTC